MTYCFYAKQEDRWHFLTKWVPEASKKETHSGMDSCWVQTCDLWSLGGSSNWPTFCDLTWKYSYWNKLFSLLTIKFNILILSVQYLSRLWPLCGHNSPGSLQSILVNWCSLVLVSNRSSIASPRGGYVLPGSGTYLWYIPGISWVAYSLSCYFSSRCQGGWYPPAARGPVIMTTPVARVGQHKASFVVPLDL